MADDGPKIFVDEDWKTQVQREKEQVAQQEAAAPPAAEDHEPENPFLALVSSLAMQAMYALGLMAPKDQKEVYVDLDQAQFLIEALVTLRDKTKGNLTPEEQGALTETLAEAQRVYVMVAQHVQEAQLRGAASLEVPPRIV
ncbi:MAG: DUF1844 domain-containing protein [Candidatus Hydrogenedentes bacterium]|nr:DUF1844 domain-containing protein [Candidatus Hydrogenedentota bacterium]